MKVPGSDAPAFSLYSTFIPRAAGEASRNVLYGYLSANAEDGPDYGELTLLRLPKQTTVPGPGQVQAQFDSDPEVGQQLNLLRQGQTEVISGNLLTLPVGDGFLYVQPVYVRSTGDTSYPLLRKILVSFGNSSAFEDTLDEALDALFSGDSGAEAGDSNGEDVTPDPAPEPDSSVTPEPAPAPEEEADSGTESGSSTEFQEAFAEAQAALDDREAAYRANDLVAAAEADRRLLDACARLFFLSNQYSLAPRGVVV
jgi:uncharacterized membrane protein (UPF0182 family)